MKHMCTFEFFSWGKKKKVPTPKERAEDAVSIINVAWEKLVKEAGGEEGLSVGKQMGYDNFGDFTDFCYDFGKEIQDIIVKDKENVKYYKTLVTDVYKKMRKITHIRGVSSLSVAQFKAARSRIELILKVMRHV